MAIKKIFFFGFVFFFCLVQSSFGKTEKIIIAAVSSLTSLEGEESLKASKLAINEINFQGGVKIRNKNYTLKLVTLDLKDHKPETKPLTALTELENFIKIQKPHALVIGPFRSEVFLRAMDILSEFRLPSLCTIAMSPAIDAKILSNPKYRFIFRISPNSKYLATYLMGAMRLINQRLGFKKVYIVNQDVAWARSTVSLMLKLFFIPQAWQVLGQENITQKTTDYSFCLKRIKDSGTQVILAIFDMEDSKFLVEQWHDQKIPAILSGFISPLVGPDLSAKTKRKSCGLVNTVFELGNIPSDKHLISKAFYKNFKLSFKKSIQAGHGPAPSYEAIYILTKAITKANSLDPELLVKALKKTDHKGVMGKITFHKGHQVIFGENPDQAALACVFQWTKDGKRRLIYPLSIAQGKLFCPNFVKPALKNTPLK